MLVAAFAHGHTANIREMTANPQELATLHEREGRKGEAAALYEDIARTVLSQRLVTLYMATGEADKALAWAREARRDNPNPAARTARRGERIGAGRYGLASVKRVETNPKMNCWWSN